MAKGKIIMINGRKIEPGEEITVELVHKDDTQTKRISDGYVRSMKFNGGLKIRSK